MCTLSNTQFFVIKGGAVRDVYPVKHSIFRYQGWGSCFLREGGGSTQTDKVQVER